MGKWLFFRLHIPFFVCRARLHCFRPREIATVLWIFLCHLLFFFLPLGEKKRANRRKPLVVRTYTPKIAKREQQSPYLTRPLPTRPSTHPPLPKKSHQVSSSSTVVHSASTKKREVIKKVEETLAKIEEKQDKSVEKILDAIPKPILTLHVDEGEEESRVLRAVVLALRRELRLPERGKVKMELIVTKEGIIQKTKVLSFENDKNRRYLEALLPGMKIPLEGEQSEKKEDRVFICTFYNQE